MSVVEQDDPVGQTLGKKFLVRRVIGAGGMGLVYEAEHVVTKKRGALKLLHQRLSLQPKTVERFVREASAAARIENPHIVETYDAGELPTGEPYMFMELLSGSSVRELLQQRRRLGFREAREIVLQAAEGLAAAHAAGIVHRDIKPENLFVTSGPPAYLKILDFGISKFSAASDHRLTAEGAPMGTPYYMSPEQVAGRSEVDARADVYALGVVLYECVTGAVPFDAPTLPALSIKIFEGRYTPPSGVLHDVPVGLDELVARAMAVEPSSRYETMLEFSAALAELGSRERVTLSATLENAAPDAQSREPAAPLTTPVAAPGSRRGVIVAVSIGVAAAAGVAIALGVRGSQPAVVPDDAGVEVTPDASISARPPAPVVAPVTPLSAEPSASPPVVPSVAVPALRSRAPRAAASAPSRAARDGLSEENPFGK
ncbi:MAG TPA: serine/threonine-protein kinase [Polyangiaceae bacterium]|nr:serine/threonine-protein kinase [Polyangiaceae bacterium]